MYIIELNPHSFCASQVQKTALELIYVVVVPRSLSPVVLSTVQSSINVTQTCTVLSLKQDLYSVIMHLGWVPDVLNQSRIPLISLANTGKSPWDAASEQVSRLEDVLTMSWKNFWAHFNAWHIFSWLQVIHKIVTEDCVHVHERNE